MTSDVSKTCLASKLSSMSLAQASDLVFQTTTLARRSGCIPIAAAVLRPTADKNTFQLQGFGHNELGWGQPFVHGETGAFRAAGVIEYRGSVLLSSLSPCEFCQGCAAHLGIQDVRYLDAENFIPDQSSFATYGIAHGEIHHQACCDHFKNWLQEDSSPEGRNLWQQDIGSYQADPAVSIDLDRLTPSLNKVLDLMRYAQGLGEFPCAAVVVDASNYQIVAYGPGSVLKTNDPSAVPEIFAGRQCGSRTRWDRSIFVTSSAPSPIAIGMYRRWGVRNIVVLDPSPISTPPTYDRLAPEVKVTFGPKNLADNVAKEISDWKRQESSGRVNYLSEIYGGCIP